jgi:Short C-terminal domain
MRNWGREQQSACRIPPVIVTLQGMDAPAEANRWQYAIVNIGAFRTADRLASSLTILGSRGWEIAIGFDKASNWLAGLEKGFMIFKRPVAAGVEPEGPWASVWKTSDLEREAAYEESRDELAQLTELHESGLMSDEQFERAKERLGVDDYRPQNTAFLSFGDEA